MEIDPESTVQLTLAACILGAAYALIAPSGSLSGDVATHTFFCDGNYSMRPKAYPGR